LMPINQLTALVNGGRLNVIGSPVRLTKYPRTPILLASCPGNLRA
jgi:hypothetical protein